MNTNHIKRALVAAFLASTMALAGLGLASGTAQAKMPSKPCHVECDNYGICQLVCY